MGLSNTYSEHRRSIGFSCPVCKFEIKCFKLKEICDHAFYIFSKEFIYIDPFFCHRNTNTPLERYCRLLHFSQASRNHESLRCLTNTFLFLPDAFDRPPNSLPFVCAFTKFLVHALPFSSQLCGTLTLTISFSFV